MIQKYNRIHGVRRTVVVLLAAVVIPVSQLAGIQSAGAMGGSSLTYVDSNDPRAVNGYPANFSDVTVRNGGLAVVGTDGNVYTSSGMVAGISNVVKAYTNKPYTTSHSVVGFAIKADGSLWSWGEGMQIGRVFDPENTGENQDDPTPTQIPGLPPIEDVQIGYDHVIALDVNGNVWSWGDNFTGELGNESGEMRILPQQITGLSNVRSISAGRSSSLAVTQDDRLMFWGKVCTVETNYPAYYAPTLYPGVGNNVKQALTDDCSVTYLTNEGLVYTWSFQGALATPPKLVEALQNIQSISTDGYLTRIAIDDQGTAFRYQPFVVSRFSPRPVYRIGNVGNVATLAWNDNQSSDEYGGALLIDYADVYKDEAIYFTSSGGSTSSLYRIAPNAMGYRLAAPVGQSNVSPDGTKVTYSDGTNLFVSDLDGSNPMSVTNYPTDLYASNPVWSPDATSIAYAGYDASSGVSFVGLIDPSGSNDARLIENVGTDTLSWSPDGTKLAYEATSEEGVTEFRTIQVDGTNEQYFRTEGKHWSDPSWSPDGTKIAFLEDDGPTEMDEHHMSASIIGVDGTGKTDVYTIPSNENFLVSTAWSPDSTKLAFAQYLSESARRSIIVAPVSGGQTFTLYDVDASKSIESLQWWKKIESATVAAPTGLAIPSPTKVPVLTWNAVNGATEYSVYRDGIQVATTAGQTYSDTQVAEGPHSYYITVVAGANQSSPSNAVAVTVDKTRPTIGFTEPTSFVGPFANGPTVTITAADTNGLSTMVIHVYKSTNQLLTTCGSATPSQLAAGTMSCSLASLPNGSYYIKAGTFDLAGNNKTINSGLFTISH